jgi:hypothetical protein
MKHEAMEAAPFYSFHASRFTPHVLLERAMGFEPTTASLEGWNSTTELRPPIIEC